MHIQDYIDQLNDYISFRTEAALCVSQLPTKGSLLKRAQELLAEDAAKVVGGTPETSLLQCSMWAGLITGKGNSYLALFDLNTNRDAIPFTMLIKTKPVRGVSVVREVLFAGGDSDSMILGDHFKERAAYTRSLDKDTCIKRWSCSPLEFRLRFPICPHCGNRVYPQYLMTTVHLGCPVCDFKNARVPRDKVSEEDLISQYIGIQFPEFLREIRAEEVRKSQEQGLLDSIKVGLKLAVSKGVTEEQLFQLLKSIFAEDSAAT